MSDSNNVKNSGVGAQVVRVTEEWVAPKTLSIEPNKPHTRPGTQLTITGLAGSGAVGTIASGTRQLLSLNNVERAELRFARPAKNIVFSQIEVFAQAVLDFYNADIRELSVSLEDGVPPKYEGASSITHLVLTITGSTQSQVNIGPVSWEI